ncbi:MAG TPA: hypothetical protein VEZ16_00105 [Microvirga sp.]|nr:hypothetical protein [Microvirga sp.]
MGEPISMAAAASTVASSGLRIAGGLAEGRSAKLDGQLKSLRYKMAAETGRVRAIQTDATYRDELATTLANINAITAGQNRGVDSATSRALISKAEQINSRARQTAVSNEMLRAITADSDAAMAYEAGRRAMDASILKILPDALSAGQAIARGLPR